MVSTETPICDVGWQAPDFTLPGIDGRDWSLQDCMGEKGLLIMFICNHCPYVKHVAEGLASLAREYQGEGVAVAGINGRGKQHITAYGEMSDVEVAYLVDPDSRLFASRSAAVEQLAGNKPTCVQDLRRALDDKTLDAVSIVTPNHWHALLAIWACQAGKDVLVEKPCSHNIVEGRFVRNTF